MYKVKLSLIEHNREKDSVEVKIDSFERASLAFRLISTGVTEVEQIERKRKVSQDENGNRN